MQDTLNVWPCLTDFRVDIDLAVTPCGSLDDIAIEIDDQNIVEGDFVEPYAVRLHEEEGGIVGQAARNMSSGKVVLSLIDEDLSRPN